MRDGDKGVSKGRAVSQGDLKEVSPLMLACKQGDEPCVLAILEADTPLYKEPSKSARRCVWGGGNYFRF